MFKLGGTTGSHQSRGDWFDMMIMQYSIVFAVLRFARELAAFYETSSADEYGNNQLSY